MARDNLLSKIINKTLSKYLSLPENKNLLLGNPKKFLIVRQHNQLGDLLAGVSLFRAIKETFPGSHITLIVSPFNYPGLIKNKFIDKLFVFDKNKIFNPTYFKTFRNLIRFEYDVVIVPVVVSISFTSNLIAGFTNAKIKIGPASLDGKNNSSAYFFDRRVDIDWRKHPDSNVSERSLDIVRPFGITTKNYKSEITFDKSDKSNAEYFISGLKNDDEILVGLHVGAGKVPNRWSLIKFAKLITKINQSYNAKFYVTGSSSDLEEIKFLKKKLDFEIGEFINQSIPVVAALISKSDLFISNDTGIMHVAGTTDTPQISIFGPTNPLNWAPIGENKYFIRKSDLIDDVSVEDVYRKVKNILTVNTKETKIG